MEDHPFIPTTEWYMPCAQCGLAEAAHTDTAIVVLLFHDGELLHWFESYTEAARFIRVWLSMKEGRVRDELSMIGYGPDGYSYPDIGT